jgi:hypothetical protein
MAWLYQANTTTKGVQFGNEEWGHPLEIGTNWTKLRVGCRIAIPYDKTFDSTTLGSLVFGLCQGTSAMWKSNNCTEFLGFRLGNATSPSYTYGTSPGPHFFIGRPEYVSKVGGAITVHTGFSANEYISGTASVRTMAFMDFTKNGGSSWTCTGYIPGNTTQATTDNGFTGFIQSMENNTTPLNCNTLTTTTFNHPGAGLLDTLYFSWQKSVPPIILFDLAAARIL